MSNPTGRQMKLSCDSRLWVESIHDHRNKSSRCLPRPLSPHFPHLPSRPRLPRAHPLPGAGNLPDIKFIQRFVPFFTPAGRDVHWKRIFSNFVVLYKKLNFNFQFIIFVTWWYYIISSTVFLITSVRLSGQNSTKIVIEIWSFFLNLLFYIRSL